MIRRTWTTIGAEELLAARLSERHALRPIGMPRQRWRRLRSSRRARLALRRIRPWWMGRAGGAA